MGSKSTHQPPTDQLGKEGGKRKKNGKARNSLGAAPRSGEVIYTLGLTHCEAKSVMDASYAAVLVDRKLVGVFKTKKDAVVDTRDKSNCGDP